VAENNIDKADQLQALAELGGPDDKKISRSIVPPGLKYPEYRKYLRHDFFYSCAYCTMMESEATSVRMTIDHYRPVASHPAMIDEYGNLLWACDTCNMRKGDRFPPPEAYAEGHRFFRPDEDIRSEHFEEDESSVRSETNTGKFTINFLDLNRTELRFIRECRSRLEDSWELVRDGIVALRSLPLDQIPFEIRSKAHQIINSLLARVPEQVEDVDSLLRAYAKSPLLSDEDPTDEESAAYKERLRNIRATRAMFPGEWTHRKTRGKRKGSKRR
jgi:hypothetical protein